MQTVNLKTPRGRPAQMSARHQTSDLSALGAFFSGVAGSGLVDEYRLRDMRITGRFVDIGAHIGSVTVAVLLDNPGTTAILVEPVPENIPVIIANLASNQLAERATIIEGAVGTTVVHYGFEGTPHLSSNRYIANMTGHIDGVRMDTRSVTVPEVTLDDLLPASAIKIDCEGGEWVMFKDPRITTVPLVFGEYHGNPGADGVRAVFEATHRVTFHDGPDGNGNFWAVAR